MKKALLQLRRISTVALTVALLAAIATPASAEDLRWESTITYSVDVESGLLHVSSEMTLTNLKGDTVSGNVITSYFYDSVEFYVPDTVESVSAVSGSSDLDVSLSKADGAGIEDVQLVTLDFGRRLFYKKAITVRVDYDIPAEAPRGETAFRVNPAYISFGAFGWGDPGRVTVKIVVPNTFDVSMDQPFSEKVIGEDEDVYTFADIADPNEFFVYVQARDDGALTSDSVDLSEYDVVVRSWPDDLRWKEDVIDTVEAGLPELQKLVGLAWRPEETLQIVESQQVTLAGYGGWYLEDNETIEIGEWVDPHLVLHELSHTWFNGGIFEGRWINEGLADEFAAAAVENAGLDTELYPRIESAPVKYFGSVALNDWVVPEFGSDDFDRYEQFGYEASFWVMQEIADDIGHAALADVLEAATNDEIAYVGISDPEKVAGVDDWRRFLDLLAERGGSLESEELFATYVTDADLSERNEARSSYADLLAAGAGWQAPHYVRSALGLWEFESAEARIAEAVSVLELRDLIESNAELVAATPAASLRDAFESAGAGLVGVNALATAQLETVQQVVEAMEAFDADQGFVETIGLLGEDLEQELAEAVSAYEADSLDDAVAEADELLRIIAAAEMVGRNRLLVTGAIVVLIVAVALALQRRRKAMAVVDAVDPIGAGESL